MHGQHIHNTHGLWQIACTATEADDGYNTQRNETNYLTPLLKGTTFSVDGHRKPQRRIDVEMPQEDRSIPGTGVEYGPGGNGNHIDQVWNFVQPVLIMLTSDQCDL